jgi:heptosyltransferase III
MDKSDFKIILSRTDSIGDVVLTLPMAGVLKKYFPACKIYFLGRTYTKEIILLSEHVDEFINYDEIISLSLKEQVEKIKSINADIFLHVLPKKEIALLAKRAGVPLRVGTTNRFFHWYTCNQLVRLSRKNSNLHEAQLNVKLLKFINIKEIIDLNEVKTYYGFTHIPSLENDFLKLIDSKKINVILHPKSKGSAKEWGLQNFIKLISLLPSHRYNVFICGTEHDGTEMKELLANCQHAINLTGKLSLRQYIAFINSADALVAASTGPLHIAAALNKISTGLFSSKRPIHPQRWAPIGNKAFAVVFDKDCEECKRQLDCDCIKKVEPKQIVDLLEKNYEPI